MIGQFILRMTRHGLLSLSFPLLFDLQGAKAQFANRADVSWLPQMVAGGYVATNKLLLLKQQGYLQS